MAKYMALALGGLFIFCTSAQSQTNHHETLTLLKGIDAEINELMTSIRENEVGWGTELLKSRTTRDFEDRYLKLRSKLDPVILMTIQDVRERTTRLRMAGEYLTSIPRLVSDMLTVVDYESRLYHIEFLIISRKATISARLAVIIASVLGTLGLVFGLFSAYSNVKFRTRLEEANRQTRGLVSVLEARQKRLLRIRRRHCALRVRNRGMCL